MNKILSKNIISLFTLKGAEYIISFVTLPYLLHILGPEKFGAIAFAQGLISYGNMIVDYGFNLTAPRDIAQSIHKEIPVHFSSIMLSKIILMFLFFFIGGFIVYCFQESLNLLLLICVLPSLIGNVIFPIWYYQGIQKMGFITFFNLIARTASVIGIFLCVKQESDYYLAALMQSLSPIIAGLISLGLLFINHRTLFCWPGVSQIKQKYRDGWEIFLSTIFISLYTNSNVIILRLLTNDTCVGYYSAANKIIEVLKGVLMPISNAIFPHVSVLAQKSKKEAIIFLKKVVKIIGGVSFILSGSMFLMADFVVQLIMGGAYTDSVQILRIISCLPFIIGLSNVFGIQTMVAFGMQTLFSRILMLSAMLNFILVFPMVYFWQSIGMAITVVLVECFVTITMYLALYKKGIKLFDNC